MGRALKEQRYAYITLFDVANQDLSSLGVVFDIQQQIYCRRMEILDVGPLRIEQLSESHRSPIIVISDAILSLHCVFFRLCLLQTQWKMHWRPFWNG